MKSRFKKLHKDAQQPKRAHNTDAGFDLTATSIKVTCNLVEYGTGIAVEIPEGYVGLVFPRSSICKKNIYLTNSVGVIDSGYRGEVMAKFRLDALDESLSIYNVGDRIAQLIIMPIPSVTFQEAEELSDSDRGTGGYGSTGN